MDSMKGHALGIRRPGFLAAAGHIGSVHGAEQIDDGVWNVYFGALELGRFHERHMCIEDVNGQLLRHR